MQKLELQSSAATDRLSRSAYCEKHGEYVEAGRKVFGHVVWFGCAKCQKEERKHQEMLQKLEEARGRAWSYRQLFGEWLPKAFDFPLESFEVLDAAMGDVYCVAEEYVRNFYRYRSEGRGLFFTGTAGTGKTKLACGVLKSLFPDVVGCYVTLSSNCRAEIGASSCSKFGCNNSIATRVAFSMRVVRRVGFLRLFVIVHLPEKKSVSVLLMALLPRRPIKDDRPASLLQSTAETVAVEAAELR